MPTRVLDKSEKTEYDKLIENLCGSLNIDAAFEHAREFFDREIESVDDLIFTQRHSLHYDRKFELQTLCD
jgi:hypothetical protein